MSHPSRSKGSLRVLNAWSVGGRVQRTRGVKVKLYEKCKALEQESVLLTMVQGTCVCKLICGNVLVETNPQRLKVIEKELSQKGIKEVLKRFAPGLLPNLTKMLISPSNIAAQSSNVTNEIGIQNPYQ